MAKRKRQSPTANLEKGEMPEALKSARNWGCVTLHFKRKGAMTTKKGKKGYNRKGKHQAQY